MQNKIGTFQAQRLKSQYSKDLSSGYFETVIARSKQVIKENDAESPADIALFTLGETYIHHDFAGRDYQLSRHYFNKLIKNFPDSPLSSEAKTFVLLLEGLDAKEKGLVTLGEMYESVILAHNTGKDRDFQKAVKNNQLILDRAGSKPPRDGALYNLGLIYANIEYPAKDFKKSQHYFNQLIEEFPESYLAGEARIWLGLLRVLEKMQQIDIEIEQQKKNFTR